MSATKLTSWNVKSFCWWRHYAR